MNLGDIFTKYGSDKHINGYTQFYQPFFWNIRNKEMNFLEIGIGTMITGVHSSMVGYAQEGYKPGGSLRSWRDFLSNSQIYGLDVQPDTQFVEDRIKTNLCDTSNPEASKLFLDNVGVKFDVILDDGSHWYENQLKTLTNFFPSLKDDGYYIIEDVYINSPITTTPQFLEKVVGKYPFFYVGVKNNICVIHKKEIGGPLRVNY